MSNRTMFYQLLWAISIYFLASAWITRDAAHEIMNHIETVCQPPQGGEGKG